MVALRTKAKYLETYYRFSTEMTATFMATIGSVFIPYVSHVLMLFYAADLLAYRLGHKHFYTKHNHYYQQTNWATLYRAGRNAAHFGIAYYGLRAFAAAVAYSSLMGGLSATVIIGILKLGVEMIYTSAEDKMQYNVRSCSGCGDKGLFKLF